jgi:hypothetical protein
LSKDDFYTPTDIDVLRMENELLAFEVSFLKAQVAETGRLENRLKESERSAARLKAAEKKSRSAEKDLVWLLRILGSSRLRWFFGLKQEIRVLEQRYLDTNA